MTTFSPIQAIHGVSTSSTPQEYACPSGRSFFSSRLTVHNRSSVLDAQGSVTVLSMTVDVVVSNFLLGPGETWIDSAPRSIHLMAGDSILVETTEDVDVLLTGVEEF